IPASSPQDRGGQGLDAPIHRLARIILDVEENLAMGIGPVIFSDRAPESPEIFRVVFGSSVVGPERAVNGQEGGEQAEGQREFGSHLTPPEWKTCLEQRPAPCGALRKCDQ